MDGSPRQKTETFRQKLSRPIEETYGTRSDQLLRSLSKSYKRGKERRTDFNIERSIVLPLIQS